MLSLQSTLPIVLPDARSWKTHESVEKIVEQCKSLFNILTDNKLQWSAGTNKTLFKDNYGDNHTEPEPSALVQDPFATHTDFGVWKWLYEVKNATVQTYDPDVPKSIIQ